MKRIVLSRGSRLLALALLYCLLGTAPAAAQTPDRHAELVYGVNAYIGNAYEGTFYTQDRQTLFLVADAPSIISPRRTLVYFWPITNKLVADWDALNEQVPGTLEIRHRQRLVASIPLADYVIQYPAGKGQSAAELYLDGMAHSQWAEFERQRTRYRGDVSGYYENLVNYRQDLDARIAAGELESEPPAPPVEPAPFLFSSTEINRGYPVQLPAGTYMLQVRDAEGRTVPQSRRRLVVFAPVSRGVAYSVIPHERYTFPELSDDTGEVIYLRDNALAYLQPYVQEEFRDLHLTRLLDPQMPGGRPDLYRWHQLDEIEQGTLVIMRNRRVQQHIERRPYAVRQITGTALGYEIHDQTTTDMERLRERRPAFHGYLLDARTLPAAFRIRLEDAEGRTIPGSERSVKIVRSNVPGWTAAFPLIPFLAALVYTGLRRRRYTRLPRDME